MVCEIKLVFTKLLALVHVRLGNYCLILWRVHLGNGVNESRNILILAGDMFLGYIFLMREENQLLHLVFSRLAKNTCLKPSGTPYSFVIQSYLKIHNFLLSLECHFSPLEVNKLLDTTHKSKTT